MTVIYDLQHLTTYRYRKPVTFGEHRAIFLPSASYGEQILSYSLTTNIPAKIRWMMDTLSNNVATITFSEPAQELSVTGWFRAEHFGMTDFLSFLQEYGES